MTPYKLGTQVVVRGQGYLVVEHAVYVTRRGDETRLFQLESHCAQCGAKFCVLVTGSQIKRGMLNRRCPSHHAQGTPVKNLHPLAREVKSATRCDNHITKRRTT